MIKGGLGTCDSIPFTEKSCENEKVEATKSDLGSENKIKIIDDNWWISNPPLKLNEIFVIQMYIFFFFMGILFIHEFLRLICKIKYGV